MAEFVQLKFYFGKNLAEILAQKIAAVHPSFPSEKFIREADKRTAPLELKARVTAVTDLLKFYLPGDYEKSLRILISILGPENPSETGMFKNYHWVMPIGHFVEKYGHDHFDISMSAIAEITKRNTGEYAIRPYLLNDPKKVLKIAKTWSKSGNFHLRRLASEGIRPRLPWAAKMDLFITKPSLIFPVLNNLKDDPVKFVQKSVANNMNDVLKDNYDEGIELLTLWTRKPTEQRKWIMKHALRKNLEKKEAKKIFQSLK